MLEIEFSNLRFIKYFISIPYLGTDINLRTAMQQKTPLMVALEHNQLEVVDLLLKRGVMMHLQLKDANGWTALHYAASFARLELSVVRFPNLTP